MSVLVIGLCLSLAGSVLLPALTDVLERRLPPQVLVRLLTAAALTTAGALGFTLSVLGLAVAVRVGALGEAGHWSPVALRQGMPVPAAVGVLAGLVALALAAAATWCAVGFARDLLAAELICRRLRPAGASVVVVKDDRLDAYALTGLRGRVIVTTAMLESLPSDERQVLIAHEMSHLRHRHHVYVQLVSLASAANPLLRKAATAVRHGVERWADEDAAATVGDRLIAARAVARAALARTRASRAGSPLDATALDATALDATALDATGGRVRDRATALLRPAPAPSRILPAALCALIVTVSAGTSATAVTAYASFEHAEISDLAHD